MKNTRMIELISVILLIVGGLNWGFVGLFGWDLVGSVFGEMSGITRTLYVLVGLSALYRIFLWVKKVK